ncbi:MAG: hypothetical protein LBJ86_05805 [Spirochaetaceae bacterium]|jgi:hypothetical protein|nr:hypothetical protein [Spirochaetaceae bacterium]
MIAIPKNIETREPPPGSELLEGAEEKVRQIFDPDSITLSDADYVYQRFFGRSMTGKNKPEKIKNAIDSFLFAAPGAFDSWFARRSNEARRILYAVVFERVVTVDTLEKALNIEIKLMSERWARDRKIDPAYNLDFLTVYVNDSIDIDDTSNKKNSLCILEPYRSAVLPRLVPPPEALLENCVSRETSEEAAYDNSADIAETVPLFCEALNGVIRETEDKRPLLRGFSKKTTAKIYAESGLPSFPLEIDKAASSPLAADLLGRFMLFATDSSPIERPAKPEAMIRVFFKQFLAPDLQQMRAYGIKDSLEYNMFFDHLNKAYGNQYYYHTRFNGEAVTRATLRDCLLAIAKDGRTFDARALVKRLQYSGKALSNFTEEELRYFKVKADLIHVDGETLGCKKWDYTAPIGRFRFDFVEKPLFLGYFYLCASLGILEITQESAPLVCERAGKNLPVSVFDGLKTVKVTEFGRWCLDISKKPPEFEKNKYEAIADSELFLVTVRGRSLERALFLDSIGERLGMERWRVNPATFLSGCENIAQVEDRIKKFHALIESSPAPHWEKLFATVLKRAKLFDNRTVDATVYKLPSGEPDEREAASELLADPELRGVAFRAEGGMLVVPRRNEKHFRALLAAHGISHFGEEKPW